MNAVSPAPGLKASPLIERLRAETRPAHAAIEQVPLLARLLAPDLTLAEYGAALQRMYRFNASLHAPLQAALAGVDGAGAYADTTRLDALAEDLATLGIRPGRPAGQRARPDVAAPSRALGVLYVMEGSTLGGRVIARRVQDQLGLTPERGAKFFGGHSADAVRARFLALCRILEREAASSSSAVADAIVAGALECFARLGAWMSVAAAAPAAAPGAAIARLNAPAGAGALALEGRQV